MKHPDQQEDVEADCADLGEKDEAEYRAEYAKAQNELGEEYVYT